MEGLTPESAELIAQNFISWMSNQGEQDYWIACDFDTPYTTFEYNYEQDKDRYTPWIVIREYRGGE